MNNFIKDIQQSLLTNEISLKEIFRNQLELAVNELLQAEMTAVLGYESYERTESTNSRNGSYDRTFDTEFGPIKVKVPRDRQNEFKNALFPSYARRADTLEDMVIKMYSKGITTREIANLIESMYGSHYSPATVSNITSRVEELAKEFHTCEFKHSQYVCVFLDATYIPLKRGTVAKEAVNIALGIRSDGGKEILSYSISPNENGEIWTELLGDLKNRGITDVQLFISDGMVGIQNAIMVNYPKAKYQRCWVHVARNLMGKVRKDDKHDIMADFKVIRQMNTLEEAKLELAHFTQKWSSKYKRAISAIKGYDDLFTFFEIPPAIRGTIYSTNIIESFNKKVKRQLRRKEQFPNEDALDRFLVTQVVDYNDKFESRSHKGFKQVTDTLDAMFI